ncbi:hypothetical protein B0H10DRAFT_894252 [Mycena sp. CBHHK59/15]|nr:hypothetical protein B0H10DRAFT_894252 [Mycena sp. CBHHK59/15]
MPVPRVLPPALVLRISYLLCPFPCSSPPLSSAASASSFASALTRVSSSAQTTRASSTRQRRRSRRRCSRRPLCVGLCTHAWGAAEVGQPPSACTSPSRAWAPTAVPGAGSGASVYAWWSRRSVICMHEPPLAGQRRGGLDARVGRGAWCASTAGLKARRSAICGGPCASQALSRSSCGWGV